MVNLSTVYWKIEIPNPKWLPKNQIKRSNQNPKYHFLKKESSQNKEKLSAFENKVYNKCKYLMKQVNKLKTALKQKENVLQVLHDNENVQRLFEHKISPSMALMLQGDLQNGQRKHQARRSNLKQKFLALELYKKSPRTYKLISRLFCLPSPSTLRRLLGNFALKAGINKMLFENIKKLSKRNPESNVCFLTFDEMSIMKNICYNSKSDEIDGYQDHGLQDKSKVLSLKVQLLLNTRKTRDICCYHFWKVFLNTDRVAQIYLRHQGLHRVMRRIVWTIYSVQMNETDPKMESCLMASKIVTMTTQLKLKQKINRIEF
ncbi:unnamed protein product [Colias eurytheme]|nr:unnamed protein product [Colias eurytheme]